jgi:hypothetical protein
MRTFWLSMHVPYACRHSGTCCSSGWAIPLERLREPAVRRLRPDDAWLRPAPGAPDDVTGVLALSPRGHCVFHDHGCEIQRALGHDALPSACQHFPREVLIDPRGVFVTLSHYCPTAADLLFSHVGAVEIVEGPPAIPHGEPEGLDARDVLPPLLTDGVLMDYDTYTAWESHMVRVLTADDDRPAEAVLDVLDADLARLQQRCRRGARAHTQPGLVSEGQVSRDGDRSRATTASEAIIRRYLAARAFASWMPYQAGGVAAVLRSLRFTLASLRAQSPRLPLKEAIRRNDLELVHLMPRDQLARASQAYPHET